ncbi:nuclear protein [Colletotrichum plurivorum]|uniref:Nuclear protein n=1 Tax=Colletotrichum plurivorum TaxID=2175906 RepID=A0A8H6KWZ8_9PEZI|nr:nuclear protein [Colletotrichum plurivorum]
MAEVIMAPADPVAVETGSPEADVSQKRKASPVSGESEEAPKRAKIDEADRDDRPAQEPLPSTSGPNRRDSNAGADVGRRGALSKEEEKKRGKRLFGGLLSTLSQTNTSSQNKRRREIEQRQHERAQKQRAEEEKQRAETVAKITEARSREQIWFDEQVMKTRHASLLARAHSLRTKAEPSVFYRPWKLTKEQEDTIADQVRDAKDTIAREVEAFNDRKDEHEWRFGLSRPPTTQEQPAPAVTEILADAPETADQGAHPAAAPAGDTDKASSLDREKHDREPHQDVSGDVVEDAGEDMVIY